MVTGVEGPVALHRHLPRHGSAAVPIFGALAARFPRRTLLPLVYAFLHRSHPQRSSAAPGGGRAGLGAGTFFIWLSVFNLFVVSVFWSFMADIWREEQARLALRLHRRRGARSAGRARGDRVPGPAGRTGQPPAGGGGASRRGTRLRHALRHGGGAPADLGPFPADPVADEAPVGGSALGRDHARAALDLSPGIALFVALGTLFATFVYFQQAQIMRAAFSDPGRRTVRLRHDRLRRERADHRAPSSSRPEPWRRASG